MSRRTPLLLYGLLTASVAVVLIAAMGFALQHEISPVSSATPALAAAGPLAPQPQPLTEEEERYAEALWPLHQEVVEASAGRLTFAGLAYAADDHDAQRLAAKLMPVRETFREARVKIAAVPAPASMEGVRERYLDSLSLYEQSATEMLNVVQDRDDGHLIDAQRLSERAAEELVKAGDVLWPGEHKPN